MPPHAESQRKEDISMKHKKKIDRLKARIADWARACNDDRYAKANMKKPGSLKK